MLMKLDFVGLARELGFGQVPRVALEEELRPPVVIRYHTVMLNGLCWKST